MLEKIKVMFTAITGKVKSIYLRVEALIELVYSKIVALLSMILDHVHGFINNILNLVKEIVSGPERFLGIAFVSIIVGDVILMGKIGAINYILNTLEFLLGLFTTHIIATALFAGSIIVLLLIVKEIKAAKK